MQYRKNSYIILSGAVPFLAGAGILGFARSQFTFVWLCALLVILCMEGRVQLGGRLPRSWLLWVHLAAAIPFFIALTLLAFVSQAAPLQILAATFGLTALFTGIPLWYRGLMTMLS